MAVPLAWSDTTDAEGIIPQTIAREEFLAALHELVPTAVSALATGEALAMVQPGDTAPGVALIAHVVAWQHRYALTDPWIAETAFLTVVAHAQGILSLSEDFPWAYLPGGVASAIHGNPGPIWSVGFPLAVPAMGLEWHPLLESRSDAKARIMAAFEDVLDGQFDRIIRDVDAIDYVTKTVTKNVQHFRWLVAYQCLGRSRNRIAREVGRDRTQVGRAIAEAANLVGITLRVAMPGRPRKAECVRS